MSNFYKQWQEIDHVRFFDAWSGLSTSMLKKIYESFNEIQLLVQYLNSYPAPSTLLEVGCATGELYRYLYRNLPQIKYSGCDVSLLAIEQAKKKYPAGTFFLCDQDVSTVLKKTDKPSIVFS